MEFKHLPVMLWECIDGLNVKEDGIYVDCTLGGGGHSLEIVKKLKTGRLICIDKDADAIIASAERLKEHKDKITFVHDDFKNIKNILDELGIEKIDGALMDLGVSSYQIDTAERGFSYMKDAPLDMRMDQSQYLTAFNVVNEYSLNELTRIFTVYGEEKFSRNIAKNMRTYHLYSVIFSIFSGMLGLILSYYYNIPTGPMIVIISGIIYFATFGLKRIKT